MNYVTKSTLQQDIIMTTSNNRDIYVSANTHFALFYGDTYKCMLVYKGPSSNFYGFPKDDRYFDKNKHGWQGLDLLKIIQSDDAEIDICARERIDFYYGTYLLVDQVIVFKYGDDTIYIFISNSQNE